MAESSYPFEKDSPDGGHTAVTQNDWQSMASMWSGDRINMLLTSTNMVPEAMPFYARVSDVNTITVQPGEAFVGGFYYKLDAPSSVRIDSNLSKDKSRVDLLVLRADLARSSVNLAIRRGAESASPKIPKPARQPGGAWELPLYVIRVPKGGGGNPVAEPVHPYTTGDDAASVAPAQSVAYHQPQGTFIRCLDPKNQYEAFNGSDGYTVTRDLGATKTYTPKILNTRVNADGRLQARGRWRWIAPNMVWYSVDIANNTEIDFWNNAKDDCISFTLPMPFHGDIGQVLSGQMTNGGYDAGMPNFVDLRGYTWGGNRTNVARILYQNQKYLHEGLDYLRVFPRKSYILFSGVYETQGLK
ncbi:hypothetical protein OG393_29175 [Streptomyces sp. NBC_01216]|uniref:hypothetical protein n=1 Tax=Streptomyces sp. NBC_01216 TaxID=2903778 RepID=UPI002E0E53AE|nr:hypothetical protein OG393_29175 [Streptomyces sp. NBC_01216]